MTNAISENLSESIYYVKDILREVEQRLENINNARNALNGLQDNSELGDWNAKLNELENSAKELLVDSLKAFVQDRK
jgi:hypothetical protein